MKKISTLIILSALIVSANVAMAQDKPEGMMGGHEMMGKGMMDKKGMMGKMMKMCQMHQTSQASIVSSSDGGVIVLSGNKLYKYDKNLNLVKEVELKLDKADMMGKGGCPMMDQMMMQKEGVQDQDKEEMPAAEKI